jgi:hypothetical protein
MTWQMTSRSLLYDSSIRQEESVDYRKNGTYQTVQKSPLSIAFSNPRRRLHRHTKNLKPTTSKNILDRSLYIPTSRKQSSHVLRRVVESHFLQLL